MLIIKRGILFLVYSNGSYGFYTAVISNYQFFFKPEAFALPVL